MGVPEPKSSLLREVLPTSGTESYWRRYAAFFSKGRTAGGYEFGQRTANVPPPSVEFPTPLRWYSWDRPKRLRVIRAVRDRILQDILALQKNRQSRASSNLSEIRGSSVAPSVASRPYRTSIPKRSAA